MTIRPEPSATIRPEPSAPSPGRRRWVDASAELNRQVRTLVDSDYPTLAGRSENSFRRMVEPLRDQLVARQDAMCPPGPSRVPFVVVVSRRMVPAQSSMRILDRGGKAGFVSADLADVGRFEPIESVQIPQADVYALIDVERGDEYLGWTPDEALPAMSARGRSALTYDEGVALLTQAPHLLEPNRCFMLGASRCGDRRVPALWISGGTGKDGRERRGAPKLGWCWAGNRHTWLGHASCAERIGPPDA